MKDLCFGDVFCEILTHFVKYLRGRGNFRDVIVIKGIAVVSFHDASSWQQTASGILNFVHINESGEAFVGSDGFQFISAVNKALP